MANQAARMIRGPTSKLAGAIATCPGYGRSYLAIVEETFYLRGKEIQIRTLRQYRYKEDYDVDVDSQKWKVRLDDFTGPIAFRGLNPLSLKPEKSLMLEFWQGPRKVKIRWTFDNAHDRCTFEDKIWKKLNEIRGVTEHLAGQQSRAL